MSVLVNGKRHSWSSIRVSFLDRTVDGITKIMYNDKTAKENLYGRGNKPVHRGNGNYEATASVSLYGYEIVAIQAAAATQGLANLTDIPPFDITVTYLQEGADQPTVDIIRNVEFVSNGRDVSQGNTNIVHEHELIVSHIAWNGVEPIN
jgi:hypothetical protein